MLGHVKTSQGPQNHLRPQWVKWGRNITNYLGLTTRWSQIQGLVPQQTPNLLVINE